MANQPCPDDREKQEALLRTRNWSEKVRDSEPSPSPADSPSDSEPDNPGMSRLHQQSEHFNARVHQVLADIPVPPHLRDAILARNKVVTIPYWRTPRAIGLAAALAFMCTGLVFWITAPREDQTFAGFRSRMVGFAIRQYSMDIHTNSLAGVQTFLAQNGAPAEFTLPAPLTDTPVKGGATLSWQGKPVSMVCFDRSNTTLYMFVIDHAAARVNPDAEIATFKNLATASWVSGDKTFLLAGDVPVEELQRLVKT